MEHDIKDNKHKDSSWTNYTLVFIILVLITMFINLFLNKSDDFTHSLPFQHDSNPHFNFTLLKGNTFSLTLVDLYGKGVNDQVYYTKLPNEVEVIMINSAKKTGRNSVGVIVDSGSSNDKEILGLAHLTEHMLFLGSRKYPNVTFFNDLITSNDGHFNGFTNKDTTTFIYDIKKEKFLESLDVFLNFFIEPRFQPEYVEKEIFTVNSEFEKNFHVEEKRIERLFQSLSNPNHPFHKFATGNKDTLNLDGKLREAVIVYFKKYFIGRNIKVIVYTNFEFNDVKNLTTKNLLQIRNPSNHTAKEESPFEPFTQKEKGKVIFFKSKFKTMNMFFVVKDKDEGTNAKTYFKKVFSSKHKHSLHHILLQNKYIFNYEVSYRTIKRDTNCISFKLLLTEEGFKNVDVLINILQRYIKLVHLNMNEKSYNKFRQHTNKLTNANNNDVILINPYENMKHWTKNFNKLGPKSFIQGDSLGSFNITQLRAHIEQMTLMNSIILIGSRTTNGLTNSTFLKMLGDDAVVLSEQEPYLKIKYKDYKLTVESVWNILQSKLPEIRDMFPFPTESTNKNKQQTDSLCEIKKLSQKECEVMFISKHFPIKSIDNQNKMKVLYKLEQSHLKTHFILNLKLDSTFNIQNKNKSVLLMKLLTIFLNVKILESVTTHEENTFNKMMEINFSTNPKNKMEMFSWQDSKVMLSREDYQMDKLFCKIKMRSEDIFNKTDLIMVLKESFISKIDQSTFLFIKEELYRQMEFFTSSNPSHQAFNWLYRLGFKEDIDYYNMTDYIRLIRREDFIEFKNNYFKGMSVEFFFLGSITEQNAVAFADRIYSTINSLSGLNLTASFTNTTIISQVLAANQHNSLSEDTLSQKFMTVPPVGSYVFQKENYFPESIDSSTLNVYFGGKNDVATKMKMLLLTKIAGNIFFSYLRVEYQLGYSIKHRTLKVGDTLMFCVYVLGSKLPPSKIYTVIDEVIEKIKVKLHQIDSLEFNNLKEETLKHSKKNEKDLDEMNGDYVSKKWGYDDDRDVGKFNESAKSITIDDLLNFVDKLLRRRLSVQISNKKDAPPEDKNAVQVDLGYFQHMKKQDDTEDEDVHSKPSFERQLKRRFVQLN